MNLLRRTLLPTFALASALFVVTAGTGCIRPGATSPTPQQDSWIDPNRLRQNAIQHESLTADQQARIQRLYQTFRDVDPSPLTQWENDFKRDVDPDQEIRIYEGMADAYRAYCTGKNLTLPAKRDVYQVVMLRSAAPDAEVLSHLSLKVLTIEDAKQILKLYEAPPIPVLVTPAPKK